VTEIAGGLHPVEGRSLDVDVDVDVDADVNADADADVTELCWKPNTT
jgi:hypothetical protein